VTVPGAKIKCELCPDHFERVVAGDQCNSCPSLVENEAVVRYMANQHPEEDTPLTRATLAELRSIRTLMSQFDERVVRMEHDLHGNGKEGLITRFAVQENIVAAHATSISENKAGPRNLLSAIAAAIALIASVTALVK
jgi:hypothetical protein